MGKYSVISGQNLYDVALHIYGSIEGIVDLMMNNTELSLNDNLRAGQELLYTDGFTINGDMVAYFRMNGIVPANGERNVYPKDCDLPHVMSLYLKTGAKSTELEMKGEGTVCIDWGDNSPIQEAELSQVSKLNHHFDSDIADVRKIRVYGNPALQRLSMGGKDIQRALLHRPTVVEEYSLKNFAAGIEHIQLLQGCYSIELIELESSNLLPLLGCKKLMWLDLSGGDIPLTALDDYLKGLVKEHEGRRNCHVILPEKPSGTYKEPKRDKNLNYIIGSGMEAIWVLVNEPAWNGDGNWKFTIRDEIYTTQA